MKTLTLLLLIISATTGYAQDAKPKTFQSDVDRKYDSIMKQSASNKAFGILGCVTGPVLIGAGLTTMLVAPAFETSATMIKVDMAVGAVLIVAGAVQTAIGPVLLVKSKKQRAAAQQYKPAVSMRIPQINYDPQARSASMRLSFVF